MSSKGSDGRMHWRARSRSNSSTKGHAKARGELTYAWPLRRLDASDANAAAYAGTLARAFSTYEPWTYVFGSHAAGADSEWLLRCSVNVLLGRGATAYVIDAKRDDVMVPYACVGVALQCDGERRNTFVEQAGAGLWAWGEKAYHGLLASPYYLGLTILSRLLEFQSTVDAMHDADIKGAGITEHVLLSSIATDRTAQRHGLGSDLLKAILADVDAKGLPAYLYTGNDSNEAFYKKFGFSVVSRRPLGDDVVIRGMLRRRDVGSVLGRWGSRRGAPERPGQPA